MKQKVFRICVSAALMLSFSFGLFACGNRSVINFTAFNTEVYIAVKGNISSETETSVKSVLLDLENSLSLNKNGEISAFNNKSAGETTALSEDSLLVFNKAKELYFFTDGLFNPAVLPLLRLWKLSSDTFDNKIITITPPAAEDIAALLPLCDFNKITEKDGAISKAENGICVDFGGIAKGYTVDKVKTVLSEAGVTEGYISVGGSSIYVFSTDEDLSVVHPRKSGEYIFTVDKALIKNAPLSTSGDYIRYYTDNDGNRYPHIINGFTGYPVNTGIASVTVIAKESAPDSIRSACATDAISTALTIMEKESATEFIKSRLKDFYVFLVYEKNGTKEIISNTDKIDIFDGDYALTLI